MRVLDSYGDDYRSSQFTIVLEVSWGRGRAAARSPGHGLHLPPLPSARTRAARAQMPPPPAMPKMSLQRKRGCPHLGGPPRPQSQAARPPARGPAGGGGGEHRAMAEEAGLR